MHPEQIGGRYRVLERLGKGAMGVVFKAHDPILDRLVAVKKMVDEIGEDEELRRRFHAEARAAAGLNHPNIVTIYELGQFDTETFIVMELLEGVDLATVIRRNVPLTVPARLSVVAQLCDGLDFAHQHGIVHRDIKPANLHLSSAGVVKILDFGIARLASSTMTGTGALLGTPDYMSPEQVSGVKIDPRSDLFAVGAVFYELMCGGRPFEAPSVPAVLMKIAGQPHVPARERAPDVPEQISDLIDRLMAKEPAARPASARAVAEEIRAMQGADAHTLSAAGTEIGAMVTQQTLVPRTPLPVTPRPVSPARESSVGRAAAASVPGPLSPSVGSLPSQSGARGLLVGGVAAAVVVMLAGVAGWYGLMKKAPVASPALLVTPTARIQTDRPVSARPKPVVVERSSIAAPTPEVVPAPVRPESSSRPIDTTTSAETSNRGPDPVATPRRALDPGTLDTLTGKRSAQGMEMFEAGPGGLASVVRIRDVLDQYARAMERQDVESVAAVRVGPSPFEQHLLAPGARVGSYQVSDVNIVVNGVEAKAACLRTVRGFLDTGESIAQSTPITVRLIRRPGGWVIADIR